MESKTQLVKQSFYSNSSVNLLSVSGKDWRHNSNRFKCICLRCDTSDQRTMHTKITATSRQPRTANTQSFPVATQPMQRVKSVISSNKMLTLFLWARLYIERNTRGIVTELSWGIFHDLIVLASFKICKIHPKDLKIVVNFKLKIKGEIK